MTGSQYQPTANGIERKKLFTREDETMKVEWRQELATGNVHVDSQHHELFEKIDGLIAACKERRGKNEIMELLGFLRGYVRNHFSAEEQYQAAHGVPNQQEHKAQHRHLTHRLDLLESEYSQEGVSLPVVTNSLMLTYEWLTHHILKSDLEMARFAGGAAAHQIY